MSGASELIESTKIDVSAVVDKTQIDELPINGRRFDSFALLTPGVTTDGVFGLVTFRGMALGSTFLTDGNDTTNQYYQEAPGRTRISAQISQDAVQEFQVITAGYLPEFGKASGGMVNTVTRSGSNDVHGTGFWFFRNRTLNARDRYAAFNPPEVRHQSGASIGGPIKKDKLFYFFNTEITRRHNPIASSITGAVIDQNARTFTGCAAPATPAQCDAINPVVARHFGQVDRRADQELFFRQARLAAHRAPFLHGQHELSALYFAQWNPDGRGSDQRRGARIERGFDSACSLRARGLDVDSQQLDGE